MDIESQLKSAKLRLLKKDEKVTLNIGSEQWLKVSSILYYKICL